MASRRAGFAVSFGAALMFMACSVHAATVCQGQVKALLVDNLGAVMVLPTFRSDWLQMCSVSAPWKGISVDLCKSWMGLMTVLRVTQEPGTFYYNEDIACNAIPTYTVAPAPAYVAITE